MNWLRQVPWFRVFVTAAATYGLTHAVVHTLRLPLPEVADLAFRLALLAWFTWLVVPLWERYEDDDSPGGSDGRS